MKPAQRPRGPAGRPSGTSVPRYRFGRQSANAPSTAWLGSASRPGAPQVWPQVRPQVRPQASLQALGCPRVSRCVMSHSLKAKWPPCPTDAAAGPRAGGRARLPKTPPCGLLRKSRGEGECRKVGLRWLRCIGLRGPVEVVSHGGATQADADADGPQRGEKSDRLGNRTKANSTSGAIRDAANISTRMAQHFTQTQKGVKNIEKVEKCDKYYFQVFFKSRYFYANIPNLAPGNPFYRQTGRGGRGPLSRGRSRRLSAANKPSSDRRDTVAAV